MLTDLRTRLRGVGSLPVMSAVNDRALDYYRNQGDLDALPDDSLERRARVLQAMGEDEMRRDRLDVARDRVHAAFASTEALLRRDPDNPDRIFAHAQSEFWVGELARRQGDEAEGARRMRNYAALAERLRAIDPDHVRALREVGYANGNLCSLAVRSPDPIVSDNCAIALDAMREVRALRPKDPQAQVDLINRLTWHGEYEHRAGRIERANRAWTEALAQTRQLVASDPDNRDSLDMLVAVLLTSGKFGLETDPTEARRRLAEADSIINDLSRFDPSNERWRRLREDVAELRSR
jgi:tetratricopeptide (TPR) repeat protein